MTFDCKIGIGEGFWGHRVGKVIKGVRCVHSTFSAFEYFESSTVEAGQHAYNTHVIMQFVQEDRSSRRDCGECRNFLIPQEDFNSNFRYTHKLLAPLVLGILFRVNVG